MVEAKLYDEKAMKRYMRGFHMSKKKKSLCVAGIEMFLLHEEDIKFIADENTSLVAASNRIHNLLRKM
jgi:hypothetical protein